MVHANNSQKLKGIVYNNKHEYILRLKVESLEEDLRDLSKNNLKASSAVRNMTGLAINHDISEERRDDIARLEKNVLTALEKLNEASRTGMKGEQSVYKWELFDSGLEPINYELHDKQFD